MSAFVIKNKNLLSPTAQVREQNWGFFEGKYKDVLGKYNATIEKKSYFVEK